VASLAQDLKDLAATLRIAGHASGELQMFGVGGPQSDSGQNGSEFDSNGHLQPPSGFGDPVNYVPGTSGEGVGSDILFGVLAGYTPTGPLNAKHEGTADAARDNVGVSQSRIDAAISGVSSDRDGDGRRPSSVRSTGWISLTGGNRYRETTTIYNRGAGDTTQTIFVREFVRPDGTTTTTRRVTHVEHSHNRGDEVRSSETRVTTRPSRDTSSGDRTATLPNHKPPKDDVGANQLRNPDHAGGSTCQNISCIIHGEKPKGLTPKDVADGASPGGLPAGPEHAGPGSSNNGKPIVSQHDLLAKYDPDSQNGGGGSDRNKLSASPGPLPPGPDQ